MRFARYSPLSFSLIISKGDEPFLTGGLLPRNASITVTVVNQRDTERSACVTKPSDRQTLASGGQTWPSGGQALGSGGQAIAPADQALEAGGQALEAGRGALTSGSRAWGVGGQARGAGGEALAIGGRAFARTLQTSAGVTRTYACGRYVT